MQRFLMVGFTVFWLMPFLILGCPDRAGASDISLLSLGPGSWSGATRVVTATVANGAVRRICTVGVGSLATAGLMTAVVVAEAMLEPMAQTAVDEIRTWMASAGIAADSEGNLTKAGPSTPHFTVQGFDDTAQAEISANFTPTSPPYSGGAPYALYSDLASCGGTYAACCTTVSGCHNLALASTRGTAPYTVNVYGCYNNGSCSGATGWKGFYMIPVGTSAVEQRPGPPVAATPQDVVDIAKSGLDAQNAAAQAAAAAAEDVVRKGLRGESVPIGAAAVPGQKVIDQPVPAPGGGTTTPRTTETDNVTANLPTDAATDLADNTTPGTTATAEADSAKEYTDPSYSGTSEVSEWAEAPNFGSRWLSFKNALAGSALFGLVSGLGNIPGGGGSTISFEAGVFGNHTVDFATWPPIVFSVISGVILVGCSWAGIKIVTLKGGSE